VFGDNPEWNFETAIIRDGKKRESKTVTNNRGELNYTPLNGAVHLRSIEAFPTTSESGGHAHSKPVKWIAAILNGIDEQIIFDMFSGSGTTIIAAQQTGRKCYAMEISPQYVDVAVKRWQDFTGEDAILESTGQTFTQVSENAL
jgi:DNA modification methylase